MKSEGNLIKEWLEKHPTPLDVRLNVINSIAFINLLTELGYRDGYWTLDEDDKLNKLNTLAHKHTTDILREIEEYNKSVSKGSGFQDNDGPETDGFSGFRG
jgi:hypothetical protein